MANPYVENSRLTKEQVEKLVFNLATFRTYREISALMGLSIQGLRPLLTKIERRMYFEIDWWPLFHMVQLSNYNPNRDQRPYDNHLIPMLELLHQVPRSEVGRGMKLEGEKVIFEDEVSCLYQCPQHAAPIPFVEKYGRAHPIGRYKEYKAEIECHKRIALKKSCRNCKGQFRNIWVSKRRPYVFRFAMEYAARFGKPRKQNEDIFIARMVYNLIWRGYDMNVAEFLSYSPIRHQGGTGQLIASKRDEYIAKGMAKDRKEAGEIKMKAITTAASYVFQELEKNPVRVDRRGNYNA